MGDFSVKFRGVRGSYPVSNGKFLKYGGNTSCVEVNVGGHLIILDAGTGIINLGDDVMEKYITSGYSDEERTPVKATVLLSHIHNDHIQGLPFFRPLHMKSTQVNVFGNMPENENLSENLSNILFGKAFPLDLEDIKGNINIKNLSDNDAIILRHGCDPVVEKVSPDITPQYDDVLIQNYKSYAHPKDGVTIYKISHKGKSLVYATDKESYLGGDNKLIDFARNCNLLIHDAQYTTEDYVNKVSPKQGYGHSTFEMALDVQNKTNAEKLVFFHLDPSYNDEKLDYLKDNYSADNKSIVAYENLELDLI